MACHSEKEQTAPTCNVLQPVNTAAEHLAVLDTALTQIPDAHRHGTDSAGGAKAFLDHIGTTYVPGATAGSGLALSSAPPPSRRRAIRILPEQIWHPAPEQDGSLRHDA